MTPSCLLGSWMLESWGTHRLRRGSISCTQMLWLTMLHGTAVGHTLHPSPSLLRLLALALARSTLSDSSRRGLHTAQPQVLLPRQLHGHFLRAPRRDRTCGHPLCIRPRSAAPSSTRAGRRVRMHSLTHGTHARRPRRMLMGHEALLLATPTCTHGVSRGSCTPPIPPKAHAPT